MSNDKYKNQAESSAHEAIRCLKDASDGVGYRGAGEVWYTYKDNELRMIYKYHDIPDDNPFSVVVMTLATAYLRRYGEVHSGMASCYEVIDEESGDIINVQDAKNFVKINYNN